MKRLFIITGTVLLILWVVHLAGATEPALEKKGRLEPEKAKELAAQTDDPLRKADLYSDAWMFEKALQVLESTGRKDAEVLWRIARSRIDLGERLEGDEALAFYEQAREEAEKAVELAPDNAHAQQTLAVALGRVALFKGVFKSIGLVKGVHHAALQAVAHGDSMPIALYILGRTHKKLIEKPRIIRGPLGLGWASEDSVAYYFDRTIEVSGGNMIQCHVEYADFLLNDRKDKAGAKKQLEAALDLPVRDENDPESIERAKTMLGEL